jgi:hypothetical protein
MARGLISLGSRSLVYLFAFFPLFYLAYKFHIPDFGGSDYFRYYEMYLHPGDLGATQEPWVLRQVQALIVNLLYRLGADYETGIAFDPAGYERGVFFSALFVNYLSVVLAAAVLGLFMERQSGRADLLSWVLPVLMGLNFSIVFFAFSGLTEGLSLLMFCLAYLGYRSGSFLTSALVVLAATFQRELVPLILLGLVTVDLLFNRSPGDRKGRLLVLACAGLSIGTNVALRMILAGEAQASRVSPASVVEALSKVPLPDREFIFQVVLTQNFAFVVALAWIMFRIAARRAPRMGRRYVVDCGLTFALVLAAGIAAGVGNNIGRLLIFCSPSLALMLAGIARDWARVQHGADA